MSFQINGIAASSGIAIAKAYMLESPELKIEQIQITGIEHELERLEHSIEQAKQKLEKIKDFACKELGEDKAAIFEAHLLVLLDPEMMNLVKEKITAEKINAEYALDDVASMFITMFEQMNDEYLKERAADIRDVKNLLLSHLLGIHMPNLSMLSEEVIIIARDLAPSETAQLNKKFVKGFITDIGGRTSHSAIMARTLEIPAVVGTNGITMSPHIQNDTILIIDGHLGVVIIDPSEEEIANYEQKIIVEIAQKAEWAKLVSEPTITIDLHQVELAANIGSPEDVEGVLRYGGEGIGLYRTEFLYMGRDQLPTEDEQYVAYKSVLEKMGTKPVVVRTLDIGGDKELAYLNLAKEMNPFLGLRAIRLCLEEQDMFRTQLRALLRASPFGNLKIMFPMIATIEEFLQAKHMLLEEKEKLILQGVQVASHIEIGIMVEIPSTAILADQFAKEVDFFSIGTNDLIQYTMAADRMNEQVAYLYQPYHPAILRLIAMVINAAHQENKWVGMCGEMAGDLTSIPILLGLGLDEFSMSASSILPARQRIRQLSKLQSATLAVEALRCKSSNEVLQLIDQFTS
jgi:phosphotransferase system enzyme I (PtsI)